MSESTFEKSSFLVVPLLLIVLLISGCGSTKYAAKTPATVDSAANMRAERLNEVIMVNAASASNARDEYRIGSEDLLDIEAYNVEDLKKTVRVNSEGYIALPLVGVIKVKDMTASQVEKVISEKLDRFVQETVVNVFVKEYRSQRISVVGAVNTPQVFAVTGQRYLIDMLMAAGGLKEDAGTICYVIRPAEKGLVDGRTETLVIDLNELLINGNLNLNAPVFAGDIINVPKGGMFFVDGAVMRPGAFTMKGKTTFVQAVAMAQGLSPEARTGDIRIFRETGKGERDVITMDYDAVRKGESPDILLSESDIIIVPQSGVKNFFSGILGTFRGFISFGKGF